mmetsp:Transcript_55270/g.173293  ORF Transcript_55270/g.173293 Transcript_55270/m.173293 type:complete len:116 (+) Transcript_55270:1-348(+)
MVYPMIAPLEAGKDSLCSFSSTAAIPLAKVAIVAASLVAAACITTLGHVNVVNGALSALVFVAVIPSVVGLVLLDTGGCHKVALRFLLVFGIGLSLLGFVFNDNYVADLRCVIDA